MSWSVSELDKNKTEQAISNEQIRLNHCKLEYNKLENECQRYYENANNKMNEYHERAELKKNTLALAKKYKGYNIFVDFYYYNEAFFKNNL